jgi:hypothetical protein
MPGHPSRLPMQDLGGVAKDTSCFFCNTAEPPERSGPMLMARLGAAWGHTSLGRPESA